MSTTGTDSGITEDQVPRLRWRDGMVRRRIELKDRSVWVVKDSDSDRFFFFEPEEYEILVRADGGDGDSGFADHRWTRSERVGFLAAATRAGLLEAVEPERDPTWRAIPAAPPPPWWTHPWAIRIPCLRYSQVQTAHQSSGHAPPADSKSNMAFAAITTGIAVGIAVGIVSALLIAIVRGDSLLADISESTARLFSGGSPGTLLLFGIAIVMSKVVHELGHILACRRFGGRCREVGVLLLIGIPCLYCDVSDTWLMRRRRDRVWVSAAGILAEWIIAAVAVWVWALTRSGPLHDFAAVMIVVTSVGTLVVNGNPLMRYDGYFILSDWVGIPNLATEAGAVWKRLLSPGQPASDADSKATVLGLAVYGLASLVYRVLVFGAIGWFVYELMRSHVGIGLAVPFAAAIAVLVLRRPLAAVLSVVSSTGAGSAAAGGDVMKVHGGVAWSAAVLMVATILLMPLPHGVRVFGIVEATGQRHWYAASTGRIVLPESAEDLQVTDKSRWIAKIDDARLELKLLRAAGLVEEIRAELRANRIERVRHPELAEIGVVLQKKLEAAVEQHAVLVRKRDDLEIRVDAGQRVFPASPRRLNEQDGQRGRRSWVGSPMEPSNAGAVLSSNTWLATSGHPTGRQVRIYVPQNAVGEVEVGRRVRFGLAGYPGGSVTGRVVSISADRVESLPPDWVASRRIEIDPGPDGDSRPLIPHYEVIAAVETSPHVLPPRLIGPARIESGPRSLWDRWRLWVAQQT